jgi:hypothetical protein
MSRSYLQFFSSLPGRAVAGAVVGTVALGTVALGTAVGALASSGSSTMIAKSQAHAAAPLKASQAHAAAPLKEKDMTTHLVKADTAIRLAEQQVGIREDQAGETKFHRWYVSTPNARLTAQRDGGAVNDYNGAAWCDMFVSWVGAQTGVKDMGWDAYTVAHAKWFQKTKRWGQTPKPGAVVFYAWNGGGTDGIDHVGLVVKDNGDGTITTVEGNTDNAVEKKVRSTTQVVGYGYPEYAP